MTDATDAPDALDHFDQDQDEEHTPPEPVKPMSAAEFEVIRLHLGWDGEPYPIRWLATALGYESDRQLYRWMSEANETPVPRVVAKHMRRWYHQGFVD